MAKLFDVIDNKFFSVLSAPNRELYLDSIFEIYQRVDELDATQDNTKDKIIEEIEYLISSREAEVIYEEDAQDLVDTRSKARYIVNHIKDCGWIYEEDLGHNVVLINFYAHAIRVVRLLREIASSTQLEHTGYIKSIYLLTQNLAESKEIAQIEQMHKQTDDLIANLKSLKSTIFTYYNNIIKKALFENAQQIFDELLRYKGDFFDKAYLNLKTYDNLSKYKDTILKTIKITAKGWAKIAELTSKLNEINQGFIAMEFSDKTKNISDSFKTAISDCGYLPKRIDEKEHNNQIVPEIFYEIEQSKFVVVDVTYQNYGAYYEAGYAQALGKQVIICCRKLEFDDPKKRPHFDISQKNMIVWEDENDLITRLKNRIEATVGLKHET